MFSILHESRSQSSAIVRIDRAILSEARDQ
jgi:hypothetical protein